MAEDRQHEDRERVLYGFWLSPYMSQVAHVLEEANLAYRYERVSPYLGGTLTDEHMARNPLAKIPCLEDVDGLYVSESQAICRYLARMYPEARRIYPCDDPVRCSEVDAKNDFITFSISGPFFNWFVFGAYFPKAFRLKTEKESHLFGVCSLYLIKGALMRLLDSSPMDPFVLGADPCLPDFQLFHLLELGRTFAKLFEQPLLNLMEGDAILQRFHAAMSARSSTKKILKAQASELPATKRELFEEFGKAYEPVVAKEILQAILGHEV